MGYVVVGFKALASLLFFAGVCGGIDCMELYSFYELCGINSMVNGDSNL